MNDISDGDDVPIDHRGSWGYIHNPSGSVSQNYGDQRNIYATYYSEYSGGARKLLPPRQQPRPPTHYLSRESVEQKLRARLEANDAPALTILTGMPGVGKTSLAAQVINSLPDGTFPGGVLWGDMEQLPSHDQLLRFLYALDDTAELRRIGKDCKQILVL